jgi:hypothetical protein
MQLGLFGCGVDRYMVRFCTLLSYVPYSHDFWPGYVNKALLIPVFETKLVSIPIRHHLLHSVFLRVELHKLRHK